MRGIENWKNELYYVKVKAININTPSVAEENDLSRYIYHRSSSINVKNTDAKKDFS